MKPRAYFLINDTRYDNHHGGLTVVRNLQAGLARRGWVCAGSLPVSATARHLRRHAAALREAEWVVVNGEGSLHHESRNTRRLFDIMNALAATHRIALVNTIWQENDPVRWKPLLARLAAVYARDRRSQAELRGLDVEAGFAPDLTFYAYPRFPAGARPCYSCTDSVIASWTASALALCERDPEINFLTLFTGKLRYRRGPRDWGRAAKQALLPRLNARLGMPVPPRWRALRHAVPDTTAFLARLASSRAICAARYHALCFALQQNIPFVAVASNSHKCEALLQDAGLSSADLLIRPDDPADLKARLARAESLHPTRAASIEAFNRDARQRIEAMFDHLAGAP